MSWGDGLNKLDRAAENLKLATERVSALVQGIFAVGFCGFLAAVSIFVLVGLYRDPKSHFPLFLWLLAGAWVFACLQVVWWGLRMIVLALKPTPKAPKPYQPQRW